MKEMRSALFYPKLRDLLSKHRYLKRRDRKCFLRSKKGSLKSTPVSLKKHLLMASSERKISSLKLFKSNLAKPKVSWVRQSYTRLIY